MTRSPRGPMAASSIADIPFAALHAEMIRGAVRWMRFMAVVQIVACFLGLVALLLVAGVASAGVLGQIPGLAEALGVGGALGLVSALLAPAALLGFQLWAGKLLYEAADAFDLVVSTEGDDPMHLGVAFRKLQVFFGIGGALAVITTLGALRALVG